MRGFADSDDEDSEDGVMGDLFAKLAALDGVKYYGISHKLLQDKIGLKTLREKRRLRASREKIRETDCESDEEESELYPGWLLFINDHNEETSESDSEEESSPEVVTLFGGSDSEDLGFESDDEEESS